MIHEKTKGFLAKFRQNESGAVTVDWVVVTAGVIALGIASMTLIEAEATSLASATGTYIAERAN